MQSISLLFLPPLVTNPSGRSCIPGDGVFFYDFPMGSLFIVHRLYLDSCHLMDLQTPGLPHRLQDWHIKCHIRMIRAYHRSPHGHPAGSTSLLWASIYTSSWSSLLNPHVKTSCCSTLSARLDCLTLFAKTWLLDPLGQGLIAWPSCQDLVAWPRQDLIAAISLTDFFGRTSTDGLTSSYFIVRRLWMLPIWQTLDAAVAPDRLQLLGPAKTWLLPSHWQTPWLLSLPTDSLVVSYHALPHYGHTHFHSCGLENIDRCSRPDLFATWHIYPLLGYKHYPFHSLDTVHSRLTPGISAIL
jgi:hypothetical protein